MERTTWGQINELFEAARRIPAEEREAWVRAATADEQMQSEVLLLLHAHEDDPWLVDEPGGRGTPASVTPPEASPRSPTPPSASSRLRRASEPKAGGQFAAYRLIREITRGPARVVFEAVATGGSARPRVALHVLAADARDSAFAALLRAEGDILAHLDHPGIPRLLDGGVAEDGVAFLAFEYAGGDPVDWWCRERHLEVRDRVSLVLAVCGAVQHAHEHLTAHGDLRPANILVSADAEVRVLDCGMAPLVGFGARPDGTDAAVHQYMSPEQARGEVLTTASDVYGLGLLLYALLAGFPPYETSGQPPARARRMICEDEPGLPSAIAGGRDRRKLAGALDRIILKALRKNPRERYATAAALAADLRAWRDGRPASVAPATPWARLAAGGGRAARAGAVALVMLAPLAGAGLLGRQAYLLRGERDQAREGLARAERQQREADEERAARRPTAADLRLEVAATTSEMALAARRAGEPAEAEALWTQALSDVRPILEASPGDIRALQRVAGVQASLGSLCRSQRRFDEALTHYRDALRARERAAAAANAPPGASLALADARTSVARLLLDVLEVRPPGTNDGARLREAGALLAQAGPAVRDAAAASPARQDALAELDRQSERLRRLTSRRR